MDTIEIKLRDNGYTLPTAPAPGGSYLPYRISGNTLYLAGVIAVQDGKMTHVGQVGDTQTVETGYAAAQVCALNVLAGIKAALGSLERVKQFLYVGGYVNAVAGFPDSPKVINGASELFSTIFGEAGKHARAAVAVAGLPNNSTVEIQVTVEFV